MRRFIIDTDTGSDDAVALLMALLTPDIKIEAITTVCGNIPLPLATKNALTTILVAGRDMPPVYEGASKPLFRELVTAAAVHGEDGMGEMNLPAPAIQPTPGYAATAILDLVRQYPGEIEIVALGPATNIATAIFLDPDAMRGVKHIYTMGTGGFGPGNTTPVAEFNVYVDAESYDIMLRAGIPLTIIGFDQCVAEGAALDAADIDAIEQCGTAVGKFAIRCNYSLIDYNVRRINRRMLDLPDPVAMAVALWPELVVDAPFCTCHTCTKDDYTYGQVIVDEHNVLAISAYPGSADASNATVIKTMDYSGFKRKLADLLMQA